MGTVALKVFAVTRVVSLTPPALPTLSPETSASCCLLPTAFKKNVNTETTSLGLFVNVLPFPGFLASGFHVHAVTARASFWV